MRTFPLLVALSILQIHSLWAQTSTRRYTVTDLGRFGMGNLAAGWRAPGSGELTGERVSGSGAIVFRDNVLAALAAVCGPGANCSPYGVNNTGQAVGASFVPGTGISHGFLFSAGVIADIHSVISLGGSSSFAAGINDSGQIVGASTISPEEGLANRHAFLYQNGKLVDLHPGVSLGGSWSEALGINGLGDIVGASQTANGNCYRAFLLKGRDNSVTDLHSLVQAGGCSTRATGINGKGEIVGSAETVSGSFRAFLYEDGTATDLNTLIPPGSGWVLEFANGIGDGGQIVGLGQYTGQQRAFLLTTAADSSGPSAAPQSDAVLTVSQVLSSQDVYVGQRIQIKGNLQIIPHYSLLSCQSGTPKCNSIIGVTVSLQDLGDSTKRLVVYQNGNPYNCSYDIQGNYECPPFINNTVIVLGGIYSKGKQPTFVVGSSSPAGSPSPPQVVTFTDFYYFDVGSPAGTLTFERLMPPVQMRRRKKQ